jgi:hypothetical protein
MNQRERMYCTRCEIEKSPCYSCDAFLFLEQKEIRIEPEITTLLIVLSEHPEKNVEQAPESVEGDPLLLMEDQAALKAWGLWRFAPEVWGDRLAGVLVMADKKMSKNSVPFGSSVAGAWMMMPARSTHW